MKKVVTFSFFLILILGLHAQHTQIIRGIVSDADTDLPLPGVNVMVKGTDPLIGAMTDGEGEFALENVPVGRHTVSFSYIGYQALSLPNIEVGSGRETMLNVSLTESVVETEEVVVTAGRDKTRSSNDMATVSARAFSVDDTERYAGSLGDPSRMAANFAGVMSVSSERNDIVIRGNSPSGLLWKLDGVEIPNPNHFGALGTTGGPVSILNNNLLDNSDFYTGAFPAQYGNAISGVFDLNMRNGNTHSYEHVFQVGFNGFELGTEGPFSKNSRASYLLNFRYSTMELVNEIGLDAGTGSSVPQYKDLSFKVNVPLEKGKISLFGIGGISFINIAQKDSSESSYGLSGTETDFGSDMGVTGLSHVHYLKRNTRIETSVSAQALRSTTELDSIPGKGEPSYLFFFSDYTESKYSVSSRLKHKFNKRNNISIGLIADHYRSVFIDSVKRFLSDMDDPTGENSKYKINTDTEGSFEFYRAFAEWKHRFTDRLSIYAGAHASYFPMSESFAAEPRAGMRWQFAPKHSFNLGAGMHSRLQPSIMYFTQTTLEDGTVIETNKDMGFTKSNQFVFSYDYVPLKNFRLKTELYYQRLHNVPVSPSPDYGWYSNANFGADFNIPTLDSLVNEGTGTNYGVELTIEKFLSKNFYFLITGSLYESKYKGYDGIERNTVFNGNYVGNALAGYELPIGKNNALGLNIKTTYAGGKRKMPIDLQRSVEEGRELYDFDNIYSERYDDYFTLDIRISFKMNMKRISQEWAFDLSNATDNQNIFRRYYNPSTERIETDYQRGIFPMFLYRLRF